MRRSHRYAPLPEGESLFDLYCRVRPFDAIVDAPGYKPANGSVLQVRCRPAARGVSVVGAALRTHRQELAS